MHLSLDLHSWEARIAEMARAAAEGADPAHDATHLERVVANARSLALAEQANLSVVVPAAWLHDCVVVPKDSPERARASTMAAERATQLLRAIGYPEDLLAPIAHAIEAHSFSAGIAPRSLEARVVQDADRLDSLGAVGLARCLMLGATLGRRLYNPVDPFAAHRQLDDQQNTIDHFYVKLLQLAERMQTETGCRLAQERTMLLHAFLEQLRRELPANPVTRRADG
jgi:uncharacterized protein